MEKTRPHPVGSRRQYKRKVRAVVRSLLACSSLIVVASGYLALAAALGQPKNILILYSFSERGLFDPLDCLKLEIRSRLNSQVNFYVHSMEAQGFEDLSYQKSLIETLNVHGSSARINVDLRQLRRWHISESALPVDSGILNRRQTEWERYQKYILAGIAVIILQTLLIAGLLWQCARRKSATGALEKLSGILIQAQEEERANIARELHDDFSQRLSLQCIELTQLEKNLPESEVEERARAMKMLAETREMSADMRSLSHQLHSSRLELVGLVCALRGLCAEITKKCEITVRFAEPNFPLNLTKEVELCLFRVAQEAIANVVRHSQANRAHIELSSYANGVSLRISDAGNGFDADLKNAGAGIGLISMRERLRLLGGGLSIRSELKRGTEVVAWIPSSAALNRARVRKQIA